MKLTGKGISPGYASGVAFLFKARHDDVIPFCRIEKGDETAQIQRLRSAIEKSEQQLRSIRAVMERDIGESEARIFDFHIGLLKDAKFIGKIEQRIQAYLENAETAVVSVIEAFVRQILAAENHFLSDRALDLKDIGTRLIRHLTGAGKATRALPKGSIIVTEELFPTDTMNFEREHLKGIVTERGSETSHAAILARSMGIPMVTALENATELVEEGMPLLVNGNSGGIVVNPDTAQERSFQLLGEQYAAQTVLAEATERKPCQTKDGINISLWANIGFLSEVQDVEDHNLEGVGLLRTEYLFLSASTAPSAKEQEEAYTTIVSKIPGVPVTIRTLDLGGDKKPLFLPKIRQANPGMDLRGLRFSLFEENLFRDQIAAILSVSRSHPIRILLPTVVDAEDFIRAKKIITDIARQENIGQIPPLGAMIETPSAVLLAAEIATESDFLSIGTNDLAQYILAADRMSTPMMDYYFGLHPAMLRSIQMIGRIADDKKIPLCVCGEIAGEPLAACILVGLGIRSFSMSPVRAARVRQAIRMFHGKELQNFSEMACQLSRPSDMYALLADLDSVLKGKMN